MSQKEKGGFQMPSQAEPGWASDLRKKYDIPDDASLEDIEAKATELLGSPLTAISGAELVLGRRVDARDQEVAPIVATPGINAREKFGLLLMQKEIEKMQAEQTQK